PTLKPQGIEKAADGLLVILSRRGEISWVHDHLGACIPDDHKGFKRRLRLCWLWLPPLTRPHHIGHLLRPGHAIELLDQTVALAHHNTRRAAEADGVHQLLIIFEHFL